MTTAKQRATGKKLAKCTKRYFAKGARGSRSAFLKRCMGGKSSRTGGKRSFRVGLGRRLNLHNCEKLIARRSAKVDAAVIAADIERFQRNMPMDGVRRRRLFRTRGRR